MSTSNKHIETSVTCYHCGDTVVNSVVFDEKQFCCNGCKSVYAILNHNNLCDYYGLNHSPGLKKQNNRNEKFAFLENSEIQQKIIQFQQRHFTTVIFYIPQMHCSSCLWLLERLHTLQHGVTNSRVHFTKKELLVEFDNTQTTLRNIVETLTDIGYEPYFSFDTLNNRNPIVDNKSRILKIGIAGFCFANIMMLSFPEYLAAQNMVEPFIAKSFAIIIFLLSIPVIFYCGTEFFVSAYKSLRKGFINIDLPVALAIAITYVRSVYEMYYQLGNGYFDSMSGIVFFMLIGRWLQDRTYQRISFESDFNTFLPIAVDVVKNNKSIPTSIEKIKEKDILRIHTDEIIPVDCILSKGNAQIDYSFVNGEQYLHTIAIGERIYAGGKQKGTLIETIAEKPASTSYLSDLWNRYIVHKKEDTIENSRDVVAKYFSLAVLIVGVIAMAYWSYAGNFKQGIDALTTVFIVACPCALLLANGFTRGNMLRILRKNKFYLKNNEVIDQILKIKSIIFDKTGTLTEINKSIVEYDGETLSKEDKKVIASVLASSTHPLAINIITHLQITDFVPIQHFKETKGAGIEAWHNEQYIKIGSHSFIYKENEQNAVTSNVYVKIDNNVLGYFKVKNLYRSGIQQEIIRLKNKYKIAILSGDNDSEQGRLEQMFGSEVEIKFYQKPDMKAEMVKQKKAIQSGVMMIGDGLNDALALNTSDVGIAVSNKNSVFTPSADAIIDSDQISLFNNHLEFIQQSNNVIWICFAFSVIYNIIGLSYAVQGLLNPIIAAILMPLSSITIVSLSYFLTNYIAKSNKLKS